MSRLDVIPPEELPEKRRALYEQMLDGREAAEPGRIGGPFDAWSLNPSIGRRIWQLGGAIRFRSTIDRRHIELAILMTGRLWEAQFEWWAHEPMAREAGLAEEVIQAVRAGRRPSFADSGGDDQGDEICWRLCRRLLDRERIDDELYAEARGRFGEAGVADLVHTCGFYTLVSMTLNTFDVQLPDGVEPPFPA